MTNEELQIKVNLETDFNSIENLNLSSSDSEVDDILDEIKNMFLNVKSDVEQGLEEGMQTIAETIKGLQEKYIKINNSISTGALLNSINIEKIGKYEYLIGTSIEDIYPLTIEYGRDEVRPKSAKVLRWYNKSGDVVFSYYSSATKPKPFVQPSFDDIENEVENILMGAISNVAE